MASVTLPCDMIYPNAFARRVDKSAVKELARSIAEVGLLSPILVRKAVKRRNGEQVNAWEILAGHHRYDAVFRELGLADIECEVCDTTDLLAELIAIDENLCRSELKPAELALQTARRKEIYEALHPETKQYVAGAHGANAAQGRDATTNLAFASETARQTGKSETSVRRDAARGDALGSDLKRIAGTSLDSGVELDALAKLSPETREDIVSRAEKGERISARAAVRPVKLADEPMNDFETQEAWLSRGMKWWNAGHSEWHEEFMSRVERPVMNRRFGR